VSSRSCHIDRRVGIGEPREQMFDRFSDWLGAYK
jgi:hypothetical protein